MNNFVNKLRPEDNLIAERDIFINWRIDTYQFQFLGKRTQACQYLLSCSSLILFLSSHCSSGQFSASPHTPRRFPRVRVSAMTSRLTRGCLTTTTGRWRNLRPASTMVRRRTVMGVWWPGSTESSSLMVEHRLSGQKKYYIFWHWIPNLWLFGCHLHVIIETTLVQILGFSNIR